MRFGRMMIVRRRRIAPIFGIGLAVLVLSVPGLVLGQAMRVREDPPPADNETMAAIIDSVAAALNKSYVFEDVALEMEKHVRKELRNGEYDEVGNLMDFTRALTEDLQDVSGDRHLTVRYTDPERMAMLRAEDDDHELERQNELEQLKHVNFMFRKLEILPGNVGYLKFDAFIDASYSGFTATAAMNFLAHTDAIIIDLRENGGGSPSIIQYMTAYFLDDVTHLNSFYYRDSDTIEQYWSAPYVPGPKMVDTDLYVLTSSYTFSGAEEFTYNLKNLERATIVGETTGGGAHPVKQKLFPSLNAEMRIPYARAVNPISGTNWEGTGVEPHVAVPKADALDTAYILALEKLREESEDEDEAAGLDWAIAGLKAKLEPFEVDEATLANYAGSYDPRKLWIEDGKLHYRRGDNPGIRAIPMAERLFRFEEIEYFRLEVVLDDSGNPVKLIGHYEGGRTDESPRTGD